MRVQVSGQVAGCRSRVAGLGPGCRSHLFSHVLGCVAFWCEVFALFAGQDRQQVSPFFTCY